MNARRMSLVVTCGLCLLVLVGCSMPWDRLGNQGGSTPLTLLPKLAAGQVGQLNPDDIQLMTDTVRDVTGAPISAVSDELAQAVVDTIKANHINTAQDLEKFGQKVAADPNSLVIPASVVGSEAEIATIVQQLSSPEVQQALQQKLQALGQQLGVI